MLKNWIESAFFLTHEYPPTSHGLSEEDFLAGDNFFAGLHVVEFEEPLGAHTEFLSYRV